MFPLDQDEKTKFVFIRDLFPLSCPYHSHIIKFTYRSSFKVSYYFFYDAVNIKGKLELVPKDDDYNMFFRLRNVELVKN